MPACINSAIHMAKSVSHLMIVDNSGNKLLSQLDLSSFLFDIIKTEEPLGFAEANNFALVNAHELGEFVVFLNQDTKTRDDWLDACIQCLQADPGIAAVTPMTKTYDWQGWDPYFLECARKSPAFGTAFDAGEDLASFYETPVIPAAAMVVRRSVLQEVGPFDPIYGSYYEDYDLCNRIRNAGYQVGVCTAGAVAHFSGSATTNPEAERRRARWVTRNRMIFNQRVSKHRWRSLLRHFLLVFPRGLLRSIFRRPSSKPLLPYLRAHGDLILLLPRLVSETGDRRCWEHYLDELGWVVE